MASKKHRGSKKRSHNKTKSRTKKGGLGSINVNELFQKIMNSMGATLSGNRTTKFHIQKCMQNELNCKRHGVISSRLQRAFTKKDSIKSDEDAECTKINENLKEIRTSQGYGGFIYRNLARNSPLRLILNNRILSLFHYAIYIRPPDNKKLPLFLRVFQHRFFRGGFKFFDQPSNVDIKEGEKQLSIVADSYNDTTQEKGKKIAERFINDSNKEEAGKAVLQNVERSEKSKFLDEATRIFNEERDEIIKHVGHFDDSYCLSIEEHEFLLKSFHTLWIEPVLKQNKLKGGTSHNDFDFDFEVEFKRFWVKLFMFIGSVGAIMFAFGWGALQNIMTAEMGIQLIVGGAGLGLISTGVLTLFFPKTFKEIMEENKE
jgi:hypothetical protein